MSLAIGILPGEAIVRGPNPAESTRLARTFLDRAQTMADGSLGIPGPRRLENDVTIPPGNADGTIAVDVHGLTKAYPDVRAVQGIDLRIQRGEIFALVGPNGAGKTTTVEILEGYRARDGGSVTVLGYDPGRHRQRLKSQIGIVLQSTGVDRYLTVAET